MRRRNVVDGGCPWWLGSNVVVPVPADQGWHRAGLAQTAVPKKAATGAVEEVVLTPLELY